MKAIFLNAFMSEKEENVFNFIDEKLAFGVSDYEHYLTDIGCYIVKGSPFLGNLIEWSNEYGLWDFFDHEYDSFDQCPSHVKKQLKEYYDDVIADWLLDNNLTFKDLKMLDLLHAQYLAIVDYSKGINILNAKRVITGTKIATGKNCLEYLVSLKELSAPLASNNGLKYWTSMLDRQGTQLCAVFTGIDPFVNNENLSSSIIMLDTNPNRSAILNNMHNQFLKYKGAINEITEEQKQVLSQELNDIYYNSDSSINSRILYMVRVANDYFKDKDIALQYVLNNYNSCVREVDIRKDSAIRM